MDTANCPPISPSPLPSKLAQQILVYLADNRVPLETHLAEEWLARQLKVSRTPVRGALGFLASMGILERRPNRGYFVVADAAKLASKPLVEEKSEDLVYFRIVEDRLSGNLPERISELELMRRYGVTKSWLTSLLRRMSKEGWIERLPGKGWEFLPVFVSENSYDQMYRFRMLVEPAALLEEKFELPPADLEKLRSQQRAMLEGGIVHFSRIETFQIGAHFHEVLVSASGNQFFIEAVQRMNRLRRLLDYRTHGDRSRLPHTCEEHLKLLDLVEAGKLEEASIFLRAHIDHERRIKLPLTRPAPK